MKSTTMATGAFGTMLAAGWYSPDPIFTSCLTTFGLAGIIGYNVVWGVTPALHSPLMAVTNAVSGMTVVGALSLGISCVNIGGGFLVTHRMLDMFKRPTDPSDHAYLYAIPALGFMGTYAYGKTVMGIDELTQMAYLAGSMGCIGGIAGLSNQKTARVGNAMGMTGVGIGMTGALGTMDFSNGLHYQIGALAAVGGLAGLGIAQRV